MTHATPNLVDAGALSMGPGAGGDDAADRIFTKTTRTGIGCGE